MAIQVKPGPGGAGIRVGGRGAPSSLLDNPLPFLRQVGVLFLAESQKAFRQQALGADAWPERINPNIPGILRDLEKGPSVKGRRFEGRPAVIDTNTLRRSLAPATQTPLPRKVGSMFQVVVGTNVPYASKQQEGGVESIRITPTMKRNLAILLRRQRGGGRSSKRLLDSLDRFNKGQPITVGARKRLHQFFNRQGGDVTKLQAKVASAGIYSRLGFLFSMDVFTLKIRPRPFIGLTPDLRNKIVEHGKAYFNGRRA